MKDRARRNGRWYRHPLPWLGLLSLAASLAGCVWLILLASRYPDPPLDTGSAPIFRMPLGESPAPAATSPR